MVEIRSSLEIAMEKADRLGKASKKEMEMESWKDEGRRLAAKYLQDPDMKLKKSLGKISSEKLSHVLGGVAEIFLRNIFLPKNDIQMDIIKRALQGVIEVKGSMARGVISQIEQLLDAYDKTKKHYYEQLKMQMQSKIGGMQEALTRQYGAAIAKSIEPEVLPQFQEEWSKISSEIDKQFEGQLKTLKSAIESL